MKYFSITARDTKDLANKLNNLEESGATIESVSFQVDKIVYALIKGTKPVNEEDTNDAGEDTNGDGEVWDFSVTYNLPERITPTNTKSVVMEGASFTTTLNGFTTNDLMALMVMMGETDIKRNVFNEQTHEIIIPKVTGDIYISTQG